MRVTAEAKSATRARIVESAVKQFAERGFEATTTRDIARAAGIAVGTLFNYFPTKESIVECLAHEACVRATDAFASAAKGAASSEQDQAVAAVSGPPSLEEELFAYVAALLRKLKPYRKYLDAVLETSLSPLASRASDQCSLRTTHLETVSQILSRHGGYGTLSPVALQLYWTLFVGVLAFWTSDRSPRQEDTLALLDQSLAMFVGWLGGVNEGPTSQANHSSSPTHRKRG